MVWKLLRLPDTTRTLTARNYLNQCELPIFHAQRSRFLCPWLVDTCRRASQTIRAGKELDTMRIIATHWSLDCFAVRCRDSQMPRVWLPSIRVAFLGIDTYSKWNCWNYLFLRQFHYFFSNSSIHGLRHFSSSDKHSHVLQAFHGLDILFSAFKVANSARKNPHCCYLNYAKINGPTRRPM